MEGFEIVYPIIGYTTGLVVVVWLLVILLSLLKIDDKNKLPGFCARCVNVRRRPISGALYCRLRCKYHPAHKYTAPKVLFVEK